MNIENDNDTLTAKDVFSHGDQVKREIRGAETEYKTIDRVAGKTLIFTDETTGLWNEWSFQNEGINFEMEDDEEEF